MNKFVIVPQEQFLKFKKHMEDNSFQEIHKTKNENPISNFDQNDQSFDRSASHINHKENGSNESIYNLPPPAGLPYIKNNLNRGDGISGSRHDLRDSLNRQEGNQGEKKGRNQKRNPKSEITPNPGGSNSGLKKSSKLENYLKQVYYNPKNPASFSEVERLYQYVKQHSQFKISRGIIRQWLSKQETYTLHHPVRRKFQRPRVLSFYKNYQWDTDTANLTKYRKDNDNYGYFAVFIDIFTCYLYTKPLYRLTGDEMIKAMKTILNQNQDKPDNIRSDQGSEYKNLLVKDFLKIKGLNIYSLFTRSKLTMLKGSLKQ